MRKYLYVSGFAQVFAHRCLWLAALVWVAYVHKYLLLHQQKYLN